MRIHRHRRFQREAERERLAIRANDRIRVPAVRVIDEEGNNLGEMETDKARAIAKERGYDLIEVNPRAQPPVCRILDFKQYKYEQEKAQRLQKAHAKKVEVKGVRLSLRIGEHDKDIRIRQAMKFFDEGNRVAVEIILRGRERAFRDQARAVILGFVEHLKASYDVTVDQPFSFQGGRSSLVLGGTKKKAEASSAPADTASSLP